jgi:hypothetical protein
MNEFLKKEARTANSTYPKGGVSCSKDSFVVNRTFVFQIKFCDKSPALLVTAKRYVTLTTPAKRTHQEIFAQSKINTYF